MKNIPAVIIGLGRIASLLEEDSLREKPCTHAGAISANPDCFLAAGCDTDEERRRLFAGRWGVPVYSDASEMIQARNPKIAVIAAHPDSRLHYCKLASDLGVPVIICEKPLADTLSSARKIASIERRGRAVILTNHERRYSADYAEAKKILAEGKLGNIMSVRAVLYMGKTRRLLDVLWHDGTHLADAVMFLMDADLFHKKRSGAKLGGREGTAWLYGTLAPRKPDGRSFGKKQEIPFVMELGAGRDHLVFEIEVSCATGMLRIGNGIFEVWESGESPYAEKFRSLKKTRCGFEEKTGYFANMITSAVSCVRDRGLVPVSSAASGLAVIEYLHSVKPWL